MKKSTFAFAVLSVALAAFALVSANAGEKPKMSTIVGQAVELSSYAMLGGGEEHSAAMQNRCEQGFPVGIVEEETGDLYICIYRHPAPASPMETANEKLLPLMGRQVAAQGLVYKSGSVNVMRVNVISEY